MYPNTKTKHFFGQLTAVLTALILAFSCMGSAVGFAADDASDVTVPVRIACVGDSITYGYACSNQATQSYPAQLQKLLGDGYIIRNFGVNSATMLKNGNKPYWKQSAYSESMSSEPDIVLLMLGTNDSKTVNWSSHRDEFLQDMEEMIAGYQNLPSHPTVYVGISPRLTVDEVMDLVNPVIVDEIVPLQRQAATEMDCPILDIQALSQTMSDSEFKDKVHPTDIGYQKIANYIYGELSGNEVSMDIIDDDDALTDGRGFCFTGRLWIDSTTSGSLNGSSGSEHYAVVTEENAAEHSYEIHFTGTRIQVYGHLSPNHGITKYRIDGGEETQCSAYSTTREGNVLLYQASGLKYGSHVLTATATGLKDADAKNACIQVDYAKVFTEKEKDPEKETESETESESESESQSESEIESESESQPESEIESESESQPESEIESESESQSESEIESESESQSESEIESESEVESESQPESESHETPPALHPPLAAAANLRIRSRKETQLTVTWDSVNSADAYRIFRRSGKQSVWTFLGEVSGTEYVSRGLKKGTCYQYKVQARRYNGATAAISADSAVLTAVTPPAVPQLKARKTRKQSIKLTWNKKTGAEGFLLQMKTSKGKFRNLSLKKTNASVYIKKHLKKGKTYAFRIRGYKLEGKKKIYSRWSKVKKIRL